MFAKVIIVLGVLGVLLGIAVTAISAILPEMTNGRVSWEEAALGIIPGVIVLLVSAVIFIIGLIMLIVARRKNRS